MSDLQCEGAFLVVLFRYFERAPSSPYKNLPNHVILSIAELLLIEKMSALFLHLQGDLIPQEHVLGYRGSAVVVLQGGLAIKTPLICRGSSDIDVIRRGQEVYHPKVTDVHPWYCQLQWIF